MMQGINPLLGWLRTVLPAGYGVAGGPIGEPTASPYRAEEALIARAVASRRFEFRAGRSYAREALLQVGCAPSAMDRDAAGAPVWPMGHVGSISHSDGLAVAVTAPRQACVAIGLDLTAAAPFQPDLAKFICHPHELASSRTPPSSRFDPARAIFTAKEASIKSLYVATGVLFDFLDLEIVFKAGGDEFEAIGLSRAPIGGLSNPCQFHGRLAQAEKIMLAVTYIRPMNSA